MNIGIIASNVTSGWVYNKVFSTNYLEQQYNPYTDAISNGWNGITPLNMVITVEAFVYLVGPTSGAAISLTNNFPPGSVIHLVNSGYISGHGGAGGSGTAGGSGSSALIVSPASANVLSISNTGIIAGGGGGGGGKFRNTGGYTYGGGGGKPLGAAGTGSAIGKAATLYTAGAGVRVGSTSVWCGDGGDWGSAGVDSVTANYLSWTYYGTSGGSPGKYIEGNSNVTWLIQGTLLGDFN